MRNKKKLYHAYRSFWPELDAVKRFHKVGVDTICFFPANTNNILGEPYCLYPPIWVWHDKYNFDSLDKQFNDLLEANPDAEFMVIVDLNTPFWWTRQNANNGAFDSMTHLGFAVNHEQWRNDTLKYMRAFLEYAESKYGNKIVAYILACGGTTEWYDITSGAVSELKEKAFVHWASDHGKPDLKRIPSSQERNHVSHDLLRDPKDDRDALLYFQFSNQCIVDAIKFFIAEARTTIPSETELGVFYGNLESAYKTRVSRGYLDYERLCDTKGLDFLLKPGSYADREMGGGSGFLNPRETLRIRGMQYLHECDQHTHTSNLKLSEHVNFDFPQFPRWSDEASTIAGLKREMAMCLIEKTSLWWFDMWGGSYQGENVMATFKQMKGIWDKYSIIETGEVAEILMVEDPTSSYYFDENNPWLNDFVKNTRIKLNRCGAPFRICAFDDLGRIPDLDRYKLIIFCNAFVIDKNKQKMLEKKVFKNQRSVLWFYAPGVINGESYDESRVNFFCGAEFKTRGLQERDMGNWRSNYLYDPKELTPALLKKLAGNIGVNIYCEEEIPVYANQQLLAIHTATGGKTKVTLPEICTRVKNLFSGDIVAEKTREFIVDLKTPDTVLFELEKGCP